MSQIKEAIIKAAKTPDGAWLASLLPNPSHHRGTQASKPKQSMPKHKQSMPKPKAIDLE